jgi:hypothetical protein
MGLNLTSTKPSALLFALGIWIAAAALATRH